MEAASSSRAAKGNALTISGYTAEQYAAMAPVNGLDLQCPVCRRLMVDPVTTICGHTMCTSCLTVDVLTKAHEPCPLCGLAGAAGNLYTINECRDASVALHKARNRLIESYFSTPMVRGRFDNTFDVMEERDPKEVHDLFRDIFWYYLNPENDQLVARAYTQTFLRLMTKRMKRRINEQIKRVHQMELEMGYISRYNKESDGVLTAAYQNDFPERVPTNQLPDWDERGSRCTLFTDQHPERLVITHLPTSRDGDAITCTQPNPKSVDHSRVIVKRPAPLTGGAAALAKGDANAMEDEDERAETPEPRAIFVQEAADEPLDLSRGINRIERMEIGSPPDTAAAAESSSAAAGAVFVSDDSLQQARPPAASLNCPPVLPQHACMHSECCACGLDVGVYQYHSALHDVEENEKCKMESVPPRALLCPPDEQQRKERTGWLSSATPPPAARPPYAYPMLTDDFLYDRMTGLIEKQEEEALRLYESMRDRELRHTLVDIGERAYATGHGHDMFAIAGNYLERSSKFLRLDKLAGITYKQSSCVSSMDFDGTGGLLAVGGTAKCVRIYDVDDLLRKDMGGPRLVPPTNAILQVDAGSKISGVAWSAADAHHLVYTEYDGIVTVHDVHSMREMLRHKDHTRRIWDIAFSPRFPRRFATCGDDGKVVLYGSTLDSSYQSIDVGFAATSVAFSPFQDHQLAVGMSDAVVSIYDTRNLKDSVEELHGHERSISYVRYIYAEERCKLVTAAVDSSCRLWDLEEWNCERVYRGHTNERNFTGMATAGDYIVSGGEGSDLFVYHQLFSRPMIKQNFFDDGLPPLAGPARSTFDEQHDRNDFISSVAWKPSSNIFAAGNNQGLIHFYKAH